MKKMIAVTVMLTTVLTYGCAKGEAQATAASKPEVKAAAQAPPAAQGSGLTIPPMPTPNAAGTLRGKVAETFDAGGYTYLRLVTSSGEEWAAVSQANVKKGEEVTLQVQMTAEKFHSSSLNRTFDRIIFGTLRTAPSAPAAMPPAAKMPANHPAIGGAMGGPAQHMTGGTADAGAIDVPKAEGANARTVAELWDGKSSLEGKPVAVRGKVVKFLGGIMGKNWLHLRDGSGSAEQGNHDLTVTTTDTAAVGDVVVVTGLVRVDKDFGAGYRYPVIVEDARINK